MQKGPIQSKKKIKFNESKIEVLRIVIVSLGIGNKREQRTEYTGEEKTTKRRNWEEV